MFKICKSVEKPFDEIKHELSTTLWIDDTSFIQSPSDLDLEKLQEIIASEQSDIEIEYKMILMTYYMYIVKEWQNKMKKPEKHLNFFIRLVLIYFQNFHRSDYYRTSIE